MKLFKRRKYSEASNGSGKDKVAKIIARFIMKMQSAFAKFMSKKTQKISSSSMKILLLIFFFSGSALSIYFITAAIIEKKQLKAVKVDRLRVPKYYNDDGVDSIKHEFFITEQTYQEMQAFKNYMDSLQRMKVGKIIYDSIMLSRPGLMDSINQLEQLYQNKK